MAGRGRPKKQVEVSKTVEELIKKVDPEFVEAIPHVEKIEEKPITKTTGWDVPIDSKIEFFDPTLSYELTGYRPVDEERGLDFNPEWFIESRRIKERSGKYCAYPPGTKKYNDFWTEEFRRCNYGYESHGYRITGDNYFFLNYYRLKNTDVSQAGSGRDTTFPAFFSKQYEYFHYIEICEKLKKDVCALKARGVGFSEIAASLGVRLYTTVRGSHTVYAAFAEKYVNDVLRKCWEQLEYLNADTEGGMRHLRQKYNSDMHKRASLLNRAREEFGFMSDIIGFVVDVPRKLRGDRVDRLFFEESGSNPILVKTYLQSTALVEILGNKFGTRFVWGTGGDSGPALDGLSKMFYNPKGFNFLPYYHNHTKDGSYAYTAFFIPAYTFVAKEGYVDSRGVTNTEKAKKFYLDKREALLANPKDHLIECAEFCFTPDDALALEGDNQFNTVLLSEQLANIKLHKIGPHIDVGQLEYNFTNNVHTEEAIDSVRFVSNPNGKVKILEHPVKGEHGSVPRNLYIAGIDGIDMGGEDTSDKTQDPSDFCVVVMKRTYGLDEPKIVCYYRDRPRTLREAHMTCLKILQYYDCQAVLESTRMSTLQFFREKHKENRHLMRRPRSTQSDIQGGRSKQFGAPATEVVIRHQLALIAQYIEDYCHNIWFEEILEEAIKYSYENKRKFDIIAAWGMVMLGDEELNVFGVTPREVDNPNNKLRPFGFWVDERGIRHKGVIPEKQQIVPKFNLWPTQYDDPTRIRSSNQRFIHPDLQ